MQVFYSLVCSFFFFSFSFFMSLVLTCNTMDGRLFNGYLLIWLQKYVPYAVSCRTNSHSVVDGRFLPRCHWSLKAQGTYVSMVHVAICYIYPLTLNIIKCLQANHAAIYLYIYIHIYMYIYIYICIYTHTYILALLLTY